MTILKRMAWGALVVIATTSVASAAAGPNHAGVLVVHATSVAYTSDTANYTGQSGIWCGNDGPEPPNVQQCEPYDPYNGTIPCVPTAANPTSTMPADAAHVWYVMAAFPPDNDSCPRVKAIAFGIKYDESKLVIAATGLCGTSDDVFELPAPSAEDGQPWPASESGMALSFTQVRTSQLMELYWFAGYAYAGATNVTFEIANYPNQAMKFVDDSVPPKEDAIVVGVETGVLGFNGTVGLNPAPSPNPVEEISWGQIKATYSTK